MLTPILMFLAMGTAAAGPPTDSVAVEVRVPLTEGGELDVSVVVERLSERTGVRLERPAPVTLPAEGVAGGLTTQWLAQALGPGVLIVHAAEQWIIRVDGGLLEPENRPEWSDRLGALASKAERQAKRRSRYGFRVRDSYRPNDPKRPTVVMIHGLNSSSVVFRHMTPLMEAAGFGVLYFDYPDQQDLARSVEEFAEDWRAFRRRMGDRRPWAIVTHSMGGLVARSYVEGESYQGDVSDLLMIGPPNGGAALARMQTLLELMQSVRAIDSKQAAALAAIKDGLGASADDLVPGSKFLRRLNGRSRRAGVRYHILAGDKGFLSRGQRAKIEARMRAATKAGGFAGKMARLALGNLDPPLEELTDGSGDGCVTVESSRLEGVEDFEVVHANHVALVRAPLLFPEPGPVICMPFVLDRLRHLLPESRRAAVGGGF